METIQFQYGTHALATSSCRRFITGFGACACAFVFAIGFLSAEGRFMTVCSFDSFVGSSSVSLFFGAPPPPFCSPLKAAPSPLCSSLLSCPLMAFLVDPPRFCSSLGASPPPPPPFCYSLLSFVMAPSYFAVCFSLLSSLMAPPPPPPLLPRSHSRAPPAPHPLRSPLLWPLLLTFVLVFCIFFSRALGSDFPPNAVCSFSY